MATSFAEGPAAGLHALNAVDRAETLDRYQPYHVARADILRRSGDRVSAHAAYRLAWRMTDNESERKFLETRLAETR